MATNKSISTAGHINSKGGETLTHIKEGAILGALIGAALGTVLAVLKVRGDFTFIDLERLQPVMIYMLFIGGFTFCFAAAGAVVGVGVPKVNPHPDQGPIKTWKPVEVDHQGQHKTFFVPEERRDNRRNPLKWGKRAPNYFKTENKEPRDREL